MKHLMDVRPVLQRRNIFSLHFCCCLFRGSTEFTTENSSPDKLWLMQVCLVSHQCQREAPTISVLLRKDILIYNTSISKFCNINHVTSAAKAVELISTCTRSKPDSTCTTSGCESFFALLGSKILALSSHTFFEALSCAANLNPRFHSEERLYI